METCIHHSVTVSVGELLALAVQLLKYGELQAQEHRCAAVEQELPETLQHT
jgi:hypothetical protein